MTDTRPEPDPVAAARRVAAEVLAPRAEDTDQAAAVPRDNLEALARAGLFGLAEPAAGVPPATMRSVQEALAGACGATYFVWAQHHSPVRLLAASANAGLRQRWLGRLCSGQAMAGVAFAYLRRPGPAAVTAEPAPGGWRVSGVAPFVTSWGLADIFVVAAGTGGGQALWLGLEGREKEGVRPSAPLALSVLQSTRTVRLALDVFVPSEDVVAEEPLDAWRRRDGRATPQPSAAALGLAGRCCSLLAARAADLGGEGPVGAAAAALSDELARCRAHSYSLADSLVAGPLPLPVDAAGPEGGDAADGGGGPLEEHLARMVEARAWGLDLAQRASLALVAALGGGAMARSNPAQRLAREAAFYVVQAQTGEGRAATLARLVAAGS